jgi:hypothetical protein
MRRLLQRTGLFVVVSSRRRSLLKRCDPPNLWTVPFNVMFHTVPSGLNEFVDLVVPELQQRGLFRHEYERTTLREHLRLPRTTSSFRSAVHRRPPNKNQPSRSPRLALNLSACHYTQIEHMTISADAIGRTTWARVCCVIPVAQWFEVATIDTDPPQMRPAELAS